jgi:hypothetical protein
MTNQEILNTINIICSGENVPAQMKKSLLESDIDLTPLLDTTIIAVENTLNGRRLSEHTGIDIAYEILIKEPNRKIILYSPVQIEFLLKKKPNLKIILGKPNVRLMESPFSPKNMVLVFETKNFEIDPLETKDALSEELRGHLSSIWHDLRKASDPLNPGTGWQADIVALGFQRAKEIFPMLIDKDNAFILNFLEEISSIREEVRKGESLSGIFCDIEGTLFSNGILNNAVLEFLNKNKKEGKEITLWSDGNLSELQSLLDMNKITYKLYAKRDFAGAIVEIAIDDMDEHSFSAMTKIYAKKFIRVQDILI